MHPESTLRRIGKRLRRMSLRQKAVSACAALALLYVAGYFMLGTYTTGIAFKWESPRGKSYHYHRRAYPFDPWIFQPAAMLEYEIRGERTKVVIKDGTYRGGEPIYGFGPFE